MCVCVCQCSALVVQYRILCTQPPEVQFWGFQKHWSAYNLLNLPGWRLTCAGFNLLMIVDFPLLSNPTHSTAAVFFFSPNQRANVSNNPMIYREKINTIFAPYLFIDTSEMLLAWYITPDIHGFYRNTGRIIFDCCAAAILVKHFWKGERVVYGLMRMFLSFTCAGIKMLVLILVYNAYWSFNCRFSYVFTDTPSLLHPPNFAEE